MPCGGVPTRARQLNPITKDLSVEDLETGNDAAGGRLDELARLRRAAEQSRGLDVHLRGPRLRGAGRDALTADRRVIRLELIHERVDVVDAVRLRGRPLDPCTPLHVVLLSVGWPRDEAGLWTGGRVACADGTTQPVDDASNEAGLSGTLGGMDWTDLDEAYLEIFGEHPDVSEGPSSVARMTTQQLEQPLADEDGALTYLGREMLEFERAWWKHAGAKETAARERWDISSTRYYQRLNALIDQPAALRHDPLLVRRLVRLRDARARQRSARRLGFVK